MRFEHDGMTLWYGTPDAPAPSGTVTPGAKVNIRVGIRPVDASHRIQVRLRVNGGEIETIPARWLKTDPSGESQYFEAHLGPFREGDTVVYGVVCSCAGRIVPSDEEATLLPVSLRVADGQLEPQPDIQPLSESKAVPSPLNLGEALSAMPSLTPILPEPGNVTSTGVTPTVTPMVVAETKAPEISRPMPPPLPTIPLNDLTGLVPNLSPELLASLKAQNIHSLADIRKMGGLRNIEALKVIKDHPAATRLAAHAQLSILSPDTPVREKLIERGFNNLFTIARSGRAEFVEKNHDVLGDLGAARLHAKAQAQAAVASNVIVEAKVHAANGWVIGEEKTVTTALPLVKTGGVRNIFEVCKDCKDCESAVSPLAYLADLIKYVKDNLLYDGKAVDYSFLEDTFHQKFGSLPASCESMDTRLRQVRIAIEVLRKYKMSTPSTTAFSEELKALRDIYHTLLIKIGTSYAELRLAQTASMEDKAALAEKLGLSKPTVTEDRLKDLLLEKTTLNSSTLLEQKLEELFGFASTQKDPLEARPTPKLLEWRRAHLRELWKEQDFPDDMPGEVYPLPDGTLGNRYPIIDPDLIGPDDFRSPDTNNAAFVLWLQRRKWIDDELKNFKAQKGTGTFSKPDTEIMLDMMVSGSSYPSSTSLTATAKWTVTDPTYNNPKKELSSLHQDLTSGQPNKEQVKQILIKLNEHFGLGADGLNRLMEIWAKDVVSWLDTHNPKVEDEEWNDLYNILTQALKRLLFPKWLEEENSKKIEFGPNEFWIASREPIEGEWPPAHAAITPWIDPDLLKVTDLPDSTAGVVAHIFYDRRKTELEVFRLGLQTTRTDPAKGFNGMLKQALGDPLPLDLDKTQVDLASNDSTTSAAADNDIRTKLYMTVDAFQRLMTIRAKEKQTVTSLKPTAAEHEEVYNILTSAHKLRVNYSAWLTEEKNAGLEYWQTLKASLPQWRATAEARADWQQKLRLRMRSPIIDPDLVTKLYHLKYPFSSKDAAQKIWSTRSTEIENKLADLASKKKAAASGKELDVILVDTLGISESDLLAIEKDSKEGNDVTARIAQLNLSNDGFNYLVRMSYLITTNSTIEEEEWEAVYSILTQVWKERTKIVEWHEEEKAKNIVLGPDGFRFPAVDQLHNLPELPAWRATFAARLDWEDILQARIDQDQALEESLRTAVDATEEVTLPTLRDVLIKEANDPKIPTLVGARKLSDCLLIEMRDNGCAKTTRIAQAIETLQNLLFSVRTGQLRDTYPKIALKSEALATFDEDWVWMGSYSAWRAAIFVFLYPENILLPNLRKKQTPAFRNLVKGLRTIGRVTPERARLAAQKYSEYFRDVCSLELQATVTAEVPLFAIEDLSPADVAKATKNKFGGLPRLFLITRSNASGNVYWCTRDGGSNEEKTQTFWSEISALGAAEKLIGATEYWLTDANNNVYERYIYLFAQVHDGRNYKLVFHRYDLTYARWIEEQNELKLPDNATSFKEVRLLLQAKSDQPSESDPYKPPQLEIRLMDDKSYIGSLAEGGKDWARLESTKQVIKFAEWTNAQLNVGDKCPYDESKFTAQNIADWIKAAHNFAKGNGFVGGFPNFQMADGNYGVIQLTSAAAVPAPWSNLDKSSIESIKKTFKDVHEEAVKREWASGFPTFDDQNTILLIKREAAAQKGRSYERDVKNACGIALSFTDIDEREIKNTPYEGGFATFNDWYAIILVLKEQIKETKSQYVDKASVGKINPTYNGPFDITAPRPNPNRDTINTVYEITDNKDASQSLLTYLDEAWYFVPVHIALQLQRSGYYIEALDWFKTIYDYTADKEVRKIFYGLIKEEKSSKDYDRAQDWLRDPLDPHGIASIRHNVNTRFTLLSVIRCLLEYADAEFTRDTSESVPLARTLYKTALELLDLNELKQSLDGCSTIIGELKLKYGDAIIQEIGLEEINNIALLESVSIPVIAIMDSSAPLMQKVEEARALVENSLATEVSPPMTIHESLKESENQIGEMAMAIMSMPGVVDEMNTYASGAVSVFDSTVVALMGKPIGEIEHMSLPFLRTLTMESTANKGGLKPRTIELMSGIHALSAGSVGLTPDSENPPGGNIPGGLKLDWVPWWEPQWEKPGIFFIPNWSNGKVKDSSTPQSLAPFSTIPELVFLGCIPPNPILKALRMRAELNLMKSWTCRNIAGVRRELEPYAAPTDTSSGMPVVGAGGQLVLPGLGSYRPTPYRYSVLIERAKQLVQLAGQVEASMLSALQQRDSEAYNMLKARQDIETARTNVTLQNLRKKEADAGVTLASLQRDRAQIQLNQYDRWLGIGLIGWEHASLIAQWTGATAYSLAAVLSIYTAATTTTDRVKNWAGAATATGQAASSLGSVFSQQASYERRKQEWEFQKSMALQDIQIGNQQIQIANDHVDVVKQEVEIAELQTRHSEDGAKFLANKFTNTELYEWMSGVLEGVYRYFLQQATAMAKLASDQLAFERQETPPAFVQSDYWEPPNEDNIGVGPGKGPERRGLTGSARLLQDIYQLDQYAFESNKRKLQLSKTISLAALAPVEFQQFRETGVMTFATPMEMFDRDFPGHYLRLIRRVKTSVVALIPPGLGIKATLTASRSTRAVIGGDIFQTIRVQHGPDVVALTSPRDATGLFEMDTQPDMHAPFENIGVDAFWEFRMPMASNLFDFNSIADVLLTVEYTALNSFDYHEQVIQNMRPRLSADRAFSFRWDFADEWYDLHNPELEAEDNQMVAVFETGRQDFPPSLRSLKIQQVVLYFARKDGSTFEIPVSSLRFTEQGTPGGVGGAATSIDGVISTRRGNASSWMSMIGKSPFGKWVLTLPNTAEIKNRFKKEEIEDILFVITYSGRTPDWPV